MILQLHGLAISFGARAVLQGVDFSIARGEAVALMGPNGAGKTTVLRCVLGLLDYQGRIEVDGFDARRQGMEARGRIGYVPQAPAFYDMSAREALSFVARLRRVSIGNGDAILDRVGLRQDADCRVRTFSGGMQQRLSLGAALIGDPPIILLDEPTANLDAQARAQLIALLTDFHAAGKTLLLSSHRPLEISGLVDRVVLMRAGRVERAGDPADVLPAARLVLVIDGCDEAEKLRLRESLAAFGASAEAARNGTCELTLDARHMLPALDALRAGGVDRERIAVRPLEEGGLA